MSENTKKRTWVTKLIIGFVAVLVLLTFFSNTIMNLFIPKVAGKRVTGGTLSYTNSATAPVEPVTGYKIKGIEGRTVEEVMVGEYDMVKKDEVLIKFKAIEDQSALEALKKELKELEREESYASRTPSETDYASLKLSVSQAEDQLKQAKDQLSKAKNKSDIIKKAEKTIRENKEKLPGLSSEVDKASGTVEELGKKDDELTGEIETREKRLKKIEPADGSEPDPSVADEIKKLKKEISDLKKDQKENKSKLDKASKRLQTASKKYSDCESAIQKAEGTLEEAKSLPSVSEAKSSVEAAESALSSAKKMLSNARTNDGIAKDRADDASTDRQDQIKELKSKIEAMEKGYNTEDLRSPVDGTVYSILAGEGDKTEEDSVLMIVVPDSTEYTVTFEFDAKSAANLNVGMEISTDTYWVEGCKILSIKPAPDDPREKRLVKCEIKAEIVFPGELVTGYLGRSNTSYDNLVPAGAVYEDNNGSFVYVIDETKSPFGNTYKVRRVDVDVEATDGATSAIMGEDIESSLIVVRSDEALENGQRVRLEDYTVK